MTGANQRAEIDDLRLRLQEAEETIRAIRSGTVDAFVVEESHGARVYTLQTADRPYRLLVEEMQQGALTLGDDGTIAYCNRRFADLVGKPLERLMGVAFRDFIPLDARPFYENLLQQGRAGAGQGEAYVRKADGGSIPVFLTLNALPPESGMAVGVLVTDLTTQRHHEKLNAALEALKESDRRKNEFLAILAHELRNPLAPIRNAVHILRLTAGRGLTSPEDETIKSTYEMMERQVGQMVRLVDDLLDVSRVNRGTIELRKERVELTSSVRHAVEACGSLYERMDHELTVTLPPQPVYLNADPTRLAQIVGNLLVNACKFTDKGGRISLTVTVGGVGNQESGVSAERATSSPAPDSRPPTPFAAIRLRDNGIGIAADQLPRIFDMFTQVDTTLERSVSGLGIGLTLVKSLVELHGGSIEAESPGPGGGSTFTVRLPLAGADAPRAGLPAAPERGAAKPQSFGRRILVVDDNVDGAESLAMLLDFSGHETRTAHSGPEALGAAREFHPEVVFLDIGLPGMNGYEVAKHFRREPVFNGIVLVALTGWGSAEDKQRSAEAGFDFHMTKPVEAGAMASVLARFSTLGAVGVPAAGNA